VAGQPPAEPLGGLLYGPSMLRDDTEAGTAFVRAYLRTINTYFAEDYKEDADFVAEVAEILEVPVEQLSSVPSLVMDWEIREGTVERLQQVYIDAEIQTSEEPLAEDDAVDRSFYEAAVGHTP
jgi:NitT/TauT family transport system substrate-binding protein